MRLLVVILNYRSASLCIDCLKSIAPEIVANPGTSVVVTDAPSGDDSVARIGAAITDNQWGHWCALVPLPKNGGFAYGNNEAIRPALAGDDKPQYVLLLNPDTVVRPGAIGSLLSFMDANPKAGIAGSRLEHPDGQPQRSAFRFHSVLGELEAGLRLGPVSKVLKGRIVAPPVPQGDQPVPTDWVAGASMIIRREVFDAIGLLDDGYFMYFEEVDFCLRAARAGWRCWYVPASRVVHLVGQSSGVTDIKQANKRRPKYWFQSRRRFFVRNHGVIKTAVADLLWMAGFASFRLRRKIQRKPDTDPEKLLGDFARNSVLTGAR
ncbi:glycosyltransferase family 2 protein [Humisphaera borealis]|uniref:Glycosyltransferase family 2 protein n=1 Tax=Humisphaera borealis TaxID=2807512 RepID=A0A7M2WQY9_9BACT|nr:glycosyltransferase family 2 protein [Humisphaera borealis]QOV87957.1 glycosyltransferase family 2 protein [Humisphaera borealis]